MERGSPPSETSLSSSSTKTKGLYLQWDSLRLVDGVLCRRFEDNYGRRERMQTVLPRAFVPDILHQFHDQPGSGGHLGYNKTIQKIRAKYFWVGLCQEVKLYVPLVMLSLRVAPHTTTGVSPAMMMFGRDINVPATMARGSVPQQEAPRLPRSEYPTWLYHRLRDLQHTVRERADIASWRMKERYDLRARRPNYRPGDTVWFYNPRREIGRTSNLWI
ncbi:Retrovirus-related Pol polyprotein from transposon 412 [Frankliniella fusca]|uniref:RNA-directed DNA polymerase n=1 Tax=Frankliniella fusca TaxID=407009 RepID=A0AAE1LE96_9NEOP|nr:Retrovirus-related Pol polyprotein from transposon 412 [Frankliniella fusca]